MKKSCSEITIYEFIRCYFHKDFSVLFTGKTVFEPANKAQSDIIAETWNKIMEEWAILTDSQAHAELLDAMNEINRIETLILRTDAALTVLQHRYSPDSIAILNELGYQQKFPKDDKKQYIKDIETVARKCSQLRTRLQMEVNRIKDLQGKAQTDSTENDFMDGVAQISRFLGYVVNIHKTTLYEYASYIRMNNKEAARLKGKQNGE